MTAAASPLSLCHTTPKTHEGPRAQCDSVQHPLRTTTRRSSPVLCSAPGPHPLIRAEALLSVHAPELVSHDAGRTHAARNKACLSFGPKPYSLADPSTATLDHTRQPGIDRRRCRERNGPLSNVPRPRLLICIRRSPAEASSRKRLLTHSNECQHTRCLRSRCSSFVETAEEHESRLAPPRGRFEMSTPSPAETDEGQRDPHDIATNGEARRAASMDQRSHGARTAIANPSTGNALLRSRRNVTRGWLAPKAPRTPSEVRCLSAKPDVPIVA
jgi:hypothetical protein